MQSGHQAEYSAIVVNEFGAVSSRSAFLTVQGIPPSFVSTIGQVTVTEGATVTLTVVTEGTLPMGYRWRRGGVTRFVVERTNSHISVLTITNVTAADAAMIAILKLLMLLTAVFGLFLMALYTELGQLLNLPSDWFYAVFPSLPAISAIILVVAIVVILLARSQSLFSGLILTLYGLITLGTLFAANIFVPDVWLRGQHYSAN